MRLFPICGKQTHQLYKNFRNDCTYSERRKETIPSKMDKRDIYKCHYTGCLRQNQYPSSIFLLRSLRKLLEKRSDLRRKSDCGVDRVLSTASIQNNPHIARVLMNEVQYCCLLLLIGDKCLVILRSILRREHLLRQISISDRKLHDAFVPVICDKGSLEAIHMVLGE